MNTEKTPELKAAEWVVAGFIKSWSMQMLDLTIYQSTGSYMKSFSFLPNSRFWGGRAPVRAYVAQNWPKLYSALDGNSPIEAKLKLAQEITKLRWNGDRPLGSLAQKERSEVNSTQRRYRTTMKSEAIYEAVQKSTSLHNWNACK